ncbi:alpha/beta fold hydrolase [Nonomuraea rubra]
MRRLAPDGDYGRPASPPWRGIDWAAHEHDADLGGNRVHYLDYGSGEPTFVLVHGLGGRWQHWLENIPALAEHGRVLALDLPGFGRSASPRNGYCLDLFADTAAALARSLGVDRNVIFLGHSLGGPVALRFAARHPDLATAIVLVAGTVRSFSAVLSVRGLPAALGRRPKTAIATYFEVATAGLPAPRWLRRAIVASSLLRQATLWPYLRDAPELPADSVALLVDGVGARGVVPTARAVGRAEPYAGLDRVACPILAIGGTDDPIAPAAELEEFGTAVPEARVVALSGAGHMVMLERARAFNTELFGFLQTIPTP